MPFNFLRLANLFGGNPDYSGYGQTGSPASTPSFAGSQQGYNPFNVDFGASVPPAPTPISNTAPAAYQAPAPAANGLGTPSDSYDPDARMKALYHPETTAEDKFNQLIQQYPQQQKLGKWGMLGAGLVGMTQGNKGLDEYLYGGQRQKVTDWKNQITPLEQAANLERYQNTNNRTIAYNTVQAELKNRKDTSDAANKDARTAIYNYKVNHPNMTFTKVKGGNIMAQDPATGKVEDTGISSGLMSDADMLQIKNTNAMDQIGERGRQARMTGESNIDEKADNTWGPIQEIHGADGTVTYVQTSGSGKTRELDAHGGRMTKVGTDKNNQLSPTQEKVDVYNRANKFIVENPQFARYVHLDSSGANSLSIDSPSDGGWLSNGPSKEDYDTIKRGIYGSSGPTNSSAQNFGNQVQQATAPPANPQTTNPMSGTINQGNQFQYLYNSEGKVVSKIARGDAAAAQHAKELGLTVGQ